MRNFTEDQQMFRDAYRKFLESEVQPHMPRFRDEDRFVYGGLVHLVTCLGNPEDRDWAGYFAQELPIDESGKTKRFPEWLIAWIQSRIRAAEPTRAGGAIEVKGFPTSLWRLVKSLSQFDPDFARAFVDGRFYGDFDHAQALGQLSCPVLVLHANWFRHPDYGLVGAMDDNDARRIVQLAPQARYRMVKANHVIHSFRPKAFVREVRAFAAGMDAG